MVEKGFKENFFFIFVNISWLALDQEQNNQIDADPDPEKILLS